MKQNPSASVSLQNQIPSYLLLKYSSRTGIGQIFPLQKGEIRRKRGSWIPNNLKIQQGNFHQRPSPENSRLCLICFSTRMLVVPSQSTGRISLLSGISQKEPIGTVVHFQVAPIHYAESYVNHFPGPSPQSTKWNSPQEYKHGLV